LLSEVKPFEDADFTQERFKQKYNADLANGLGNLVARTSNLIEKNNLNIKLKQGSYAKLKKEFDKKMTAYQFDEALKILWSKLSECDETITKTQPWKINDKDKLTKLLESLAQNILNVAELLEPFIPATSQRIIKILTAPKIKKSEALFPRLNS
jgi:methionyl-tRNA synthetase